MPDTAPPSVRILTSWPLAREAGTGTVTFLEGFREGIESLGLSSRIEQHDLSLVDDYAALLAERTALNESWQSLSFTDGETIVGLDWDGYSLTTAQRDNRQVIASPRGLFADLAPTEPLLETELRQQAAWEQINLERCDWCFVASHYAKRQVMHYYGIPAGKIAVLPNGLNESFRRLLQTAEPLGWSTPTILSIAKFYPRKQIPLLIEAFAEVHQSNPHTRLCVIGDGFEAQRVRELVVALDLMDAVDLPGIITDPALLARYYASCTVFCHPSVQETFGNVLLEAMAAGKPIVASDAASLPEVAGEVGMYVMPGDAGSLSFALTTALDALESQPGLGAEIRERARRRAAHYTWQAHARGFLACWNQWRTAQQLPAEFL